MLPTGVLCISLCLLCEGVSAQTADQRRVRRVEVDAGGGIFWGADLGLADANLRANDSVQQPYRLFSTGTRFASAPLFHVRTGFSFNRRIGVEGGFMLSRPEIRTSVSADVENVPPITIAERVDQYVVDGNLVIMLNELRLGRRTVPFVAGGAGYVRQLHEGQTVVEQGHVYHASGGVKHWLRVRNRGGITAAGVRADATLYLMFGGIAFEDRPRPHVAISGSAFVTF